METLFWPLRQYMLEFEAALLMALQYSINTYRIWIWGPNSHMYWSNFHFCKNGSRGLRGLNFQDIQKRRVPSENSQSKLLKSLQEVENPSINGGVMVVFKVELFSEKFWQKFRRVCNLTLKRGSMGPKLIRVLRGPTWRVPEGLSKIQDIVSLSLWKYVNAVRS